MKEMLIESHSTLWNSKLYDANRESLILFFSLTVLQRKNNRHKRVNLCRSVHWLWKCRGSSQEWLCAINCRMSNDAPLSELRSSISNERVSHIDTEDAATAQLPSAADTAGSVDAIQERAWQEPEALNGRDLIWLEISVIVLLNLKKLFKKMSSHEGGRKKMFEFVLLADRHKSWFICDA